MVKDMALGTKIDMGKITRNSGHILRKNDATLMTWNCRHGILPLTRYNDKFSYRPLNLAFGQCPKEMELINGKDTNVTYELLDA